MGLIVPEGEAMTILSESMAAGRQAGMALRTHILKHKHQVEREHTGNGMGV